jgi:aminomethyltransferase
LGAREQEENSVSHEQEMLRSALHDVHVALEAKMGVEAGWEVPLSYHGALDEAAETRRRASIFDLSHFGRIRIRGDGALDLLERACTADTAHQEDNTTLPTLLCNERGGIIDCARAIRLTDFWVLVTSPICRTKVLQHLTDLAGDYGVKVDDQTPKTTMLGVAGPGGGGILSAVLPFSIDSLGEGDVKFGSLMIARYIAERVDLFGLWAAMVSIPNMTGPQGWRFITEKAGKNNVPPAGLTAFDVLRIEAGTHRYGHEINETIDPYTCGLDSAVAFDHDFIGAKALAELSEKTSSRRLTGLVLHPNVDKSAPEAIPRQGSGVLDSAGKEIGTVTSGTFSPALNRPIALAMISADARVEKELLIETAAGRIGGK